MGTDIHLVVEAKDDNGTWQMVPGPVIDCWSCNGTGIAHTWDQQRRERRPAGDGELCYWCKPPDPTDDPDDFAYYSTRYVEAGKVRDQWYSDRHYVVFALLGNVRNGHGFAGVYTHEPIVPLSDCAGFPDDMTAESLAWMDARGGDHSDTWVLLRDVLKYDYDQPLRRGGVVTLREYDTYLRRGELEEWSGDVSGRSVKFVSEELAKEMVKRKDFGDGHTYVRIRWAVPLGRAVENFIERMKMLAVTVGEHECRLIFNFDS